ncbi:hypothetical protein ACJRO7_011319 [Eucalyptus globulus]|uniref:ARM repeat N-terminal plant domain-containing protein n=1 Tax=Eucalyptus globulus TaxID=34317 RepID=A0ABD3LES0_EUCGL
MDKTTDCPYSGCFFSSILKFFRELPSQDDNGRVRPISGLWNTAMAHPNDPEFIELGMFECMAALIWKGLKNRRWRSHDQNIYIPYYAAHIIGSYTMNMDELAERAVRAGVISPLIELLRGRLTWVEQRMALRALRHLATYASTFPTVASHVEILELSIQLAMSSLEIVFSPFYQDMDRRLSYHCDLLARGTGGVEMESRKAEEWASQLQCWALQLINCFAFKPEFLPAICKPEFLVKLPGMWGGLVNESSPAGIGFRRTICHHKIGRGAVASCPGIVEALRNIARSSDDWQYRLLTVVDEAVPALVDLSEITALGVHKKLGDSIVNVLEECIQLQATGPNSLNSRTKEYIDDLLNDLHIKRAASLVVKLEGNSLFSSGDIAGAASKYSEAAPMRAVLYSNRAQCYLLLQQALAAISDATRALGLHTPLNRHAKRLWRRAQAYGMLGFAKESLLDAILFINECSQSNDPDLSLRPNKIPDYAERLVKKQMRAAWVFREAATKHGGVRGEGDSHAIYGQESDDPEWETASERDIADDGRDEMDEDDENENEWKNKDERKEKALKKDCRDIKRRKICLAPFLQKD